MLDIIINTQTRFKSNIASFNNAGARFNYDGASFNDDGTSFNNAGASFNLSIVEYVETPRSSEGQKVRLYIVISPHRHISKSLHYLETH